MPGPKYSTLSLLLLRLFEGPMFRTWYVEDVSRKGIGLGCLQRFTIGLDLLTGMYVCVLLIQPYYRL